MNIQFIIYFLFFQLNFYIYVYENINNYENRSQATAIITWFKIFDQHIFCFIFENMKKIIKQILIGVVWI